MYDGRCAEHEGEGSGGRRSHLAESTARAGARSVEQKQGKPRALRKPIVDGWTKRKTTKAKATRCLKKYAADDRRQASGEVENERDWRKGGWEKRRASGRGAAGLSLLLVRAEESRSRGRIVCYLQ